MEWFNRNRREVIWSINMQSMKEHLVTCHAIYSALEADQDEVGDALMQLGKEMEAQRATECLLELMETFADESEKAHSRRKRRKKVFSGKLSKRLDKNQSKEL